MSEIKKQLDPALDQFKKKREEIRIKDKKIKMPILHSAMNAEIFSKL